MVPSKVVTEPCLRVRVRKMEWRIDLPELTSMQFQHCSFSFKDDELSELVMRSTHYHWTQQVDLPKLITLNTHAPNSTTFQNPRSITLESIASFCQWQRDIPNITLPILSHDFAFSHKNKVMITGSSLSSLLLQIDIGGLWKYFHSPVYNTHNSPR